MLRQRLAEEAAVAKNYGQGPYALFRGAMHEFAQPGMRIRVFFIFCAFSLQNLSGAAAINYYSPTLFSSLGVTDVALYTGIYGLVKGTSTSYSGTSATSLPSVGVSFPSLPSLHQLHFINFTPVSFTSGIH